jgi:methylmalonyl-CoA epimerase
LFGILGLNHVGIAVFDLDEASQTFSSKFGLSVSDRIESKSLGLHVALVNTKNCILELMEPVDKEGTVAKFLEQQKRNSLHHLAFAVDSDLSSVALDLKDIGVGMIYPEPRIGIMGHPVNFCHPKFTSNLLIELYEGGIEVDKLNHESP